MRFWYFVTADGAQVQGLIASPKNPHGQGYTQSDIFFVLLQRKENYYEGISKTQLSLIALCE